MLYFKKLKNEVTMRRFFLIITLINTFIFGAGFGSFSEDTNSKFLTPQEAFKVKASTSKDSINIDIMLGNKIHIYKNKLKVLLTKPNAKDITPTLPQAKKLDNQEIYEGNLTLQIPFSKLNIGGDFGLKVKLTGCSDAGICYAPQEFDFNLSAPTNNTIAPSSSTNNTKDNSSFFGKISKLAKDGNSKQIVQALKNEGLLFILALFFVVGLLLALTPCILPMVPILSSILLKQAKNSDSGLSKGASFSISLVYVVSMAAAYAVIGVVAGMLNFDLQANANNPYVIVPIALIFIALAFSLFGYYELAMPSSLQTKLNKISNNAQGKGYLGTAIMGAISALVVGACTAPVISGAIIFISITGDALLGGLALFVMGLGAGMPLLLVGLGANKFVPKPGGWMENVSKFFGVLMLLMALYIARGVISPTLFMILFSALLIGSAIFFGLFDAKEARGFGGIFKVFNFFMLLYGSLIFIGAISGAKSILDPLSPFKTNSTSITKEQSSHKAASYSLEDLLNEIKNAKKPVVVDIGKENCAACTELAEITFPDKEVKQELKRFKFIKLDITKYTKDDQDIMKHFKLFGAPNILFFNSQGKALEDKFQQGFVKPKKFVEILKSIE
jgi:thiol:disulfide interchange protein DsbD